MSRSSLFTAVIAVPRRATALIALLIAAVVMISSPGMAQTTTGSIRGYARDEGSNGLSGVQVTARNLDIGTTRTTTTNVDGFYNIGGLRPGQYELSTRRLGFTAQTRNVTVQIGQTLSSDFRLAQAAAQLAGVVVQASTSDVHSSEVGSNVTRDQIQNLPNFERNFLDLARLVPGVTQSAVNSTDKVFAAGGQAPEAVNVFVDGATYKNDVLRGGVAGQDASKGNPFPQAAVQEFRVVTQNYKAEYQKASSAIITATTRTGSKAWEGDAFAFGVGNSYAAKDAFGASRGFDRPNYKRLQAGGSLGGPIAKDKLFFFGTYELNFRDEPSYVTLGGNAAQAPPSLNLQSFTGQFQQQFREHLGFGKLTWVKSDRSTIDASLNIRQDKDFRGFGGQTAFQSAENMNVGVQNGVVNWKYAGDRWLNEAQVNAQHFVWNPKPVNETLIGRDYQGLLRIGGKDTRQRFTQNRLSLRDDITRSGVAMAGDHVIKMGASLDLLSYESVKDFNYNPVFRYRVDENWSRPFEAAFGFGDPKIATNNAQIGLYAQDDWSPTQKLVFNLGVRWDVETNMINNGYVTPQALADSLRGPLASQFYVDVPKLRPDGTCCDAVRRRVVDELGGIDRYITSGRSDRPMYLGAIQPRLGASYDVNGDGRTVLFGGAGIYYDRNYWNTLLDERFRRQYNVLTAHFNATGPNATCSNCVAWNDRFYDPAQLRTLSGTSALPEVFLVANDMKPPKSYQYSAGVRQTVGASLVTLSYNGIRGYNGMNFVRATPWGGLGPNYAQAFIADDRVRTWYDAMQLGVERPLRTGMRWGGSLAYTLARAQEQGQSQDIFWPFDDRFPTVGDLPKRRAPNNQTHTIVANGIVRLPADFRMSGILTLGSGMTANGTNASQGWDLAKQSTYVFTPPTRPFLGVGHVFATQVMDMRAEKQFVVSSGQNVGVVVDLFNVFNSANFGCYDATIFPTSGSPNANYAKPGCAGLGRRLQLGLRYGLRSQ